jgi:hypothetical protein
LALYTNEDVAADYGDSTRVQLFSALKPLLAGVTCVVVLMNRFQLGQAEVAALGQVSGNNLTRLTVGGADVQSSFWPAVWTHLPSLNTLRIGDEACLGNLATADIIAFCSHAPRPFTLQLQRHLYDELHGGSRLQELCRLWGAPLVTLESKNRFAELP